MLPIKHSLATKQMVRISLISLVIICIFLIFLSTYFIESRRKDYFNQLERVFHSIEQPLSRDIWNMNYDNIQHTLDDLSSTDLVTGVDVIIPGQYRSLHSVSKDEPEIPEWFTKVFRLPVTAVHPLYAPDYNNEARLPIAQLVMKSDSYQMYTFILRAGTTLLFTFFLLTLLQATAMICIMNRLLISPLKLIANKINQMPKGIPHQITQPAGHDDDELGMLVRSYNRNQQALEKAYQGLRRLNTRDRLTDLPNRVLFDELLNQQIVSSDAEGSVFSLLYVGVSSMSETANTFWRPISEQLLLTVTARLNQSVKNPNILAHLGGGEFVIIAEDNIRATKAMELSQEIIRQLTAPIEVNGFIYYLSVNIGVAHYPNDGKDAQLLINNAHSALTSANNQGKNRIIFFEPQLAEIIEQRQQFESELTQGIQNKEFVLYLQPQMDMRTDTLVGVEALVRWYRGDEIRSPDKFIPLAEETGLIVPLGNYILEQACQYISDWQHRGIKIPISVNLAAAQVTCDNFPTVVSELIARYRIQPEQIKIEVTETGRLEHIDSAIARLQHLHDKGFAIVLDDFGIGYSNLNYLRLLDIDMIKIDKSFVLNEEEQNKSLVKIIGMIANTFSTKVIAEGVETQGQKAWLLENGIHYGQGYFYDRPLPKDDLEQRYLAQYIK